MFASLWLGLLLSSCKSEKEAPKEIIRPVRTCLIEEQGQGVEQTLPGRVEAGKRSALSFKVSGTVETVMVHVGERLEEGSEILELDARDYELRVAKARAAVGRARAKERNARLQYSRSRKLYENSALSRARLEEARAAAQAARASLTMLEKRLEQARLQLSYTVLCAPFDCDVIALRVELDENVSPAVPVVVVTSRQETEVEVAAPASLLSQISEGMKARVVFESLGKELHQAEVTELGAAATSGLTAFPVTLELDRDVPGALPGMSARVTFELGLGENGEGILAPASALSEDGRGRFVYVVQKASQSLAVVERRSVETGRIWPRGVEIVEGLREGERIVVAGVSELRPGMKVRILPGEKAQ